MMRYSIGDEATELFSEHRTPGGAVRNVVTEAPRSASFRILPLKQAEVFRTPEECHNTIRFLAEYTHAKMASRKRET